MDGAVIEFARSDQDRAAIALPDALLGPDGVSDLLNDLPLRLGRVRQRTLRNPIHCEGVGLHSGRRTRLVLRPGEPDSGILFRRSDLGVTVPGRFDNVVDTRLCTVLAPSDRPDARIGTVEHVMAALAACGIDNAVVDVDGPEVPVLDGTSRPFVFLIDCAGAAEQESFRGLIEVLRPVRVEDGPAWAELRPSHAPGFTLSLGIAFDAAAIGRQSYSMRLSEAAFRRELADCRTFTLRQEIEAMRAAGLARGGSLDNAIVVDGAEVLNPGGLRRADEFVRHKMLDAVGDLALAGLPLRGAFHGFRSGHGLNNRLLRALLSDPAAWRLSGGAVRRAA
ncbi:UDP-3-O-acyl-N-acetylglucosamine deacetylase [Rhizosaccharibacter radicis]|uniref:UDP-3-O-acyl-N-acetylglucosamine deacetylase n=1 Tax=Rhizosaccharibacter radicis TaxID=2782605 RepID=A0ABT1VY26_9PROT|nr:UDP-3-O-acyl-N-acetylglucosamine deacetylase [Acetobacteraceae bacterium KSS12]